MFDKIHPIELDLMRSLQAIHNPLLDSIMLVLNYVDTMPFYVFFILSIWFFYNQKQGIKIYFIYLLSAFINQSFKMLFAEPRPCILDPSLCMLKSNSFGFPSGAAQTMVVLFGFLSITFKKHWVWCVSIFSILIVSFSRIYLGLHFFSDIIGGWILGVTVLGFSLFSLPHIERFITKHSKITIQTLALLVCIVFWLCTLNFYTKNTVISAFGVSIGLIWGPFLKEPSNFAERTIRFLTAIIGIAILFGIMSYLLIVYIPNAPSLASKCLGSFLATMWLTFGVSYSCKRINL